MDLNYMQAWRSKEKAMQLLRGTSSESYKKIPLYIYMLEYANPGSVTRLHTEVDGSFLYAFIAIYASTRGWIYCRPAVLKQQKRSSVPYDTNIVYKDTNRETFYPLHMQLLIRRTMYYGSGSSSNQINLWTKKGNAHCIIHAWWYIERNFNCLSRRLSLCMYVLSAEQHKDELQEEKVYIALTRTYTIEQFNSHMAELEAIDSRVKTYLMGIGYDKWSWSHSKANRTMTITSHIAESLNAANKHARDLQVVNLLDFITRLIQK
ncbi:uncharacterized protein [Nicotiana sylvestris]|uniref:uncharacterized protein n=1 Tax=Nicotiana sylvestris TaxID=4096 RepID=UPI00388CE13F